MAIDLTVFDAGWTFDRNSGIAADGPNHPWNQASPVPSASNFAFIHNLGKISQSFTTTRTGAHTIALRAQIRPWFNVTQTFVVKVDGVVVGSSSYGYPAISYFSWTPVSIVATIVAGTHVLSIEGQNVSGDETALIDSVSIKDPSSADVPLLKPGFDGYQLAPDAIVTNPPVTAVASYRLIAKVTTTGRWLFCKLTRISDGSVVPFTTVNQAPTIYVDGVGMGPVLTADIVQEPRWHTGILIPLPDGVTVNPGQVVTLSADAGWVFGPAGYAEAMSGQSVANRSGTYWAYDSAPAPTMKIGTGVTGATASYTTNALMRNWRYRCGFSSPNVAATDSHGKPTRLSGSPTSFPVCGGPDYELTNIDGTRFPTRKGYWAVRWDDLDGGADFTTGTNLSLAPGDVIGTTITEVTSLANRGVSGIGKVRVFDVQYPGPVTNARIMLRVTKGDLNCNFANDAVLAPGDFTWAPDTPTVIPPVAWSDLSAVQVTRMPTTLPFGAFRPNDALVGAGGVDAACEPEHMVDHDDWHYSQDVKEFNSFGFTQARPLDPATSPYLYSSVLGASGSPYDCTLGTDVSTTSAAGTREVWTIPDAATAPVFRGLVLAAGGERMRVMSVTGTAVTVERGSEGTTPTTHAAGVIQCCYRLPMASLAAWGGRNYFVTELVTDRPHRLSTGQQVKFQGQPWPNFQYTDGRFFSTGGYTFNGFFFAAFVTGANSFVTAFDSGQSPVNPNNVTLNTTYSLNPANCYVQDYYPADGGFPHEITSAWAAHYPGSVAWVCFPTAGNNAMADESARRNLAALPPGGELWIELSDEPWNYSYKSTLSWFAPMDHILYGSNNTVIYAAHRTAEIRQRFFNIFNAAGRGGEVKALINLQCGSVVNTLPTILSTLHSEGLTLDGVAIAPYYNMYEDVSIYKAYAKHTSGEYVDVLTWDAWFGGGPNDMIPFLSDGAAGVAAARANPTYGKDYKLLIYEYAPQITTPHFEDALGAPMDAVTTTLVLSHGVTNARGDTQDASRVQRGSNLLVGSEWVKVTSRSGVTCTVVRGQSGTTAAVHPSGTWVRNDWLEGNRDVILHPNFRQFTLDVYSLFQAYGVSMCVNSAQSYDWAGGWGLGNYNCMGQEPGAGDGSDGRFDNRLCQARPGPGQKPASVNQDANTVSVDGQAMIDWYRVAATQTRRRHRFIPRAPGR